MHTPSQLQWWLGAEPWAQTRWVKGLYADPGKSLEFVRATEKKTSNTTEIQTAKGSFTMQFPKSVQFFVGKIDPQAGRQLIVKANDASRMIIVEGYGDPQKKPDLIREWRLPIIKQVSKFALNKY